MLLNHKNRTKKRRLYVLQLTTKIESKVCCKAMRSENLIEYSIKMRVESIISVTEKSNYYAIVVLL